MKLRTAPFSDSGVFVQATMRVLIYSMHFWPEPTGVGKYSGEMATWLSQHGHAVRALCSVPWYPHWKIQPPYGGRLFQRESVEGVEILRTGLWVPSRPTGFTRIICLMSFAVSSLISVIRSMFWKPDVVFCVEPPFFCLPAGLILARLCRARAWLHVQDFEVDAALSLSIFRIPGMSGILRWTEAFLFRRFDRCSTISPRMAERLADRSQRSDIVLFPNWVDCTSVFPLDRPSSFRQELALTPKQRIALYAGNIGEKQGLEVIVEAANRLQHRDDIVFVLCGHGAAADRIRAMSDGRKNIRWLPVQPVDKLNDLLNLADVHLLPQRADVADLVMPSKLTGMLASGRPVVAIAGPGTQVFDIVRKCGRVVPPDESDEFASAIADLIDQSDTREAAGKQARRIAADELGMEKLLLEFAAHLTALCEDGTVSPA